MRHVEQQARIHHQLDVNAVARDRGQIAKPLRKRATRFWQAIGVWPPKVFTTSGIGRRWTSPASPIDDDGPSPVARGIAKRPSTELTKRKDPSNAPRWRHADVAGRNPRATSPSSLVSRP